MEGRRGGGRDYGGKVRWRRGYGGKERWRER